MELFDFTSLFFFTTRKKGGRHIGGARGAGEVPMTLWLILLTSFKLKLNHFPPMDVGRKWNFFLPTSFRENMYRNSQIDVVIWSILNFFGWFGKTLWPLEKSCRRPSEKILTKILIYMSSCEGFVIFQATCKNFMIYPKNGQKMNFTSFYTHKSFDPKYFKMSNGSI